MKRAQAESDPGLPVAAPEGQLATGFRPGQSGNPATQFQPGQSGNPEGSRAKCRYKLSEKFVRELYADFEQHGASAIVAVRERRPHDYLKIVASLVPKEIRGEDGGPIRIAHVVFKGINDDETLLQQALEAGDPIDAADED